MKGFIKQFGAYLGDKGLKCKYLLFKADGSPVDEAGMYFILKLNSKDKHHRRASLGAARQYSRMIRKTNPQLAHDLEMACNAVDLESIDDIWKR